MSKFRLVSSYTAMVVILTAAAWGMFLSFPLEGKAQVLPTVSSVLPVASVSIPSKLSAAVLPQGISTPTAAATSQDAPPPPPPPPAPSGVVGGRRGGGGQDGNAPPPPPPPPPPPSQGARGPIRVGGDVEASKVVYKVNPPYPPEARSARIEGSVVLQVAIGQDGRVTDVRVVTATSPALIPGVVEAVAQWVYSPTLLNGEPVDVITTVTVNFSLN